MKPSIEGGDKIEFLGLLDVNVQILYESRKFDYGSHYD